MFTSLFISLLQQIAMAKARNKWQVSIVIPCVPKNVHLFYF